jgi:hypothetical protein
VIPFACGIDLCSSNYPTHKGGVYLFPHPHKIKTKRTIKTKNPKNSIEKAKRREKRKPTRNN